MIPSFNLPKYSDDGTIKLQESGKGCFVMDEEKKFEIEVLTRLTKIETMLEDFKGVENKTNEAYTLSLSNKRRLDRIEDNNKWLFRTAVGAVITGIIGIVLNFIK